MKKYDAIIIGSGQAGTPLVFKYASQKMNVALIEKQHFGGTCLNVGCTPTKAYVASAKRIFDAKNAEQLGIIIPAGIKADMHKIKRRKDKLIEKSVEGLSKALKNNEFIDVYEGSASFINSDTVNVNGVELSAEKIFINVGARAVIPEAFEKMNYLTNEEILELDQIPEHLIIVGGSYVGLEFGQMFKRFGSKVTVVEKGDSLLPKEDEEVSKAVKDILEEEGIKFKLNATCISGTNTTGAGVKINISCEGNESEINGSHLLLAVGRQPNNDSLNLENAGIQTDKRGFINVNDMLETNIEGVFALGDCNGKSAFTHTSYNDFEIVADHLFGSQRRNVSDRIHTYSMFTDPPLGRAGMTLAEAKKHYNNVKTAFYKMEDVARAQEKGETKGFLHIVINGDNDRILGASFLGVGSDEVIASILNVMYANKPYTLIRDAVYTHPTVSELIPTMLENVKPI